MMSVPGILTNGRPDSVSCARGRKGNLLEVKGGLFISSPLSIPSVWVCCRFIYLCRRVPGGLEHVEGAWVKIGYERRNTSHGYYNGYIDRLDTFIRIYPLKVLNR